MYNMFYNTSLYLEWAPRVIQPSHPSWGGSRLGAEFDILRHRRWSWLTMDEQVMWPSLWPSFVFVSKIKDSYCPSPKKLGWTTRRELVESWCGCCEPVGNRNGWNCISHKLAVTRFTASLQYQVSFCFSFRPGQLQMCLHIFNPHNITPALLPQLKQSCQIWVNYFS